ncbi:MAG: alkaline phosphatase D family protein [Gammaproteobacteria bacterium]|nr:alkaline phosphatase D family protein [Gammaproteobacteria bacterium]
MTLNRRHFLHTVTLSASAIATASLTGCGGGGGGSGVVQVPSSGVSVKPEFFPQSVASGDPRPSSVILWTRIVDAGRSGDIPLTLQLAADAGFTTVLGSFDLTAFAEADYTLKVRVGSLPADFRFYYRFVYVKDGQFLSSKTGRTRTAPATGSTRAVKFAYASCQDFNGRYYNPYLKLLDQDLDFVVHLGDYIYETTGDPRFQTPTAERQVSFTDTAGAVALGSADARFYAAQSLSNYRELYKTYRGDTLLQKVQELFPIIAIWDDHEFADDSWGATASHSDGRENEKNETRKRNAEQAWFEYMPVDPSAGASTGALGVQISELYPNSKIYREFRFGTNVHLMMTDFRTYRPDHLIAEDAFPGTIAVDRLNLSILLGNIGIPYEAAKAKFDPYVAIDAAPWDAYKPVLIGVATQGYMAEGLAQADAAAKAASVIKGNLSTTVINQFIAKYNAAVPEAMRVAPIAPEVLASLDTGISYAFLGKTSLFGNLGARYFAVKDTFDLFAAYKYNLVSNTTQDALGLFQEDWLKSAIGGSPARWKIVGSSVAWTKLLLDLSNPAFGVPAPFNQKFYLNLDHWDGFGNRRDALLGSTFKNSPGTVIISGDIHSAFVTDHGQGTIEFTGPSVSSGTFTDIIRRTVEADPVLSQLPAAGQLVASLAPLMQQAYPAIKYANSTSHGVVIMTAAADGLSADYYELPEATESQNLYADAAGAIAQMQVRKFKVNSQNKLEILG